MPTERSVAVCVARLRKALDAPHDSGALARPVIRRKVRRLLADAGRKIVNKSFIGDLNRQLTAANVYTNRPLLGRPLFQDEWLEFSARPFPPHAALFQTEHELVEFMRRAVGTMPPLDGLHEVDREFSLGSRRRIDLLCEERAQSGKGDLVAVEFKKGDPSYDVVVQLDAYLDELGRHPLAAGRQVRGLIISGPDEDARSAVSTRPRNQIDWFVYSVSLTKRP